MSKDNFSVTMVGDRELIARIDAMPMRVKAALVQKVTALTLKLEAKIKDEKLSGQVLHVRSGALRRSIFSQVQETATSVYGRAASSGDVKYAAIREFGGKTPAHVIEPVKARALHFMMGGKEVFAKRVNHPGSVIPQRSFMRSALADMRQEIVGGMEAAVRDALAQK